MTTFEIGAEFRALEDLINNSIDPETGEVLYDVNEALQYEIEALKSTRDDKLESIEYLKRELKASEEALKEEAKRLKKRADSLKKKQDYLKGLQDYLLKGKKLKTDKFTFSYRISKSVDILNIELLPSEFKAVEYKPLKTEISKALKDGKEVAGAELIENKSLSVR